MSTMIIPLLRPRDILDILGPWKALLVTNKKELILITICIYSHLRVSTCESSLAGREQLEIDENNIVSAPMMGKQNSTLLHVALSKNHIEKP